MTILQIILWNLVYDKKVCMTCQNRASSEFFFLIWAQAIVKFGFIDSHSLHYELFPRELKQFRGTQYRCLFTPLRKLFIIIT